ncbi:hypothetical protein GE09DRAFT_1291192 [Coniochaeta sp. 2T2.1]|nr:hypothetical protein GE09DRAFT_1291192 [Coniochaeta sp. 2T2.1]
MQEDQNGLAWLAAVLDIFNEDGIDFVRLKFEDFAGIVRLLGSQGEYKELERILRDLRNSREVKEWDPTRVLSIGRLLVHVYHANGKLGPAIEMCGRLLYNLQRSIGYLHPDFLAMSSLLAPLYATGLPSSPATRRPDEAMNVYEEILRQIDFACSSTSASSKRDRQSDSFRKRIGYNPVASAETDPKVLAAAASLQYELLRRAHARLGAWTKPVKEFSDLHARLTKRLGKDKLTVASPEAWKGGGRGSRWTGVVPLS